MKKYLFFDIDGTLLTGGYEDGYVPESAQLALHKLRENGHFLAIATGRSHIMAVAHMHALGIENMVSDGGYGLTIQNKLLEIAPLPKDRVCALIRECECLGYPWGLQVDNTDTRIVPDRRFEDFTHDTYLKSRIVPNLNPEEQEAIFKAYIACYPPDEERLTTLSALPWCRYHREYFFVEPTDKAVGIRKTLDFFHADYRDAIVFGDGKNDISMFTDEWTKVAMGNAVPELKTKADLITTDVDQDGIYNACLKLGLI